ncbi:MAG: hypothetical protein P4L92_14315 [Rudaea sp.]|nr:hypothetical protein [Rudaea sp.]
MSLVVLPPIPRNSAITELRAPHYIRRLQRFFGREELARVQQKFDRDLLHHGRMYRSWRNDRQPWLFSFRRAEQWRRDNYNSPCPLAIQKLVGDAQKIVELKSSMTESVQQKYKKDLFLENHLDCMLEIETAWHYYVQGFNIAWYEPGQKTIPEFRVQGGGPDFDVECRRFKGDIADDIKFPLFGEICDVLFEAIAESRKWGYVNVEVSAEFVFSPAEVTIWKCVFGAAVLQEKRSVNLANGLTASMDFESAASPIYSAEQLPDLATKLGDATGYFIFRRQGEKFVEPIGFRCLGPRKTPEELTKRIYNELKRKVDRQLSPERAGVLVARFEGVYDPNVFNSEGMKDVVRSLFKRTHLAACVLQATDSIQDDEISMLHTIPSVLYINSDSPFGDVGNAAHLVR